MTPVAQHLPAVLGQTRHESGRHLDPLRAILLGALAAASCWAPCATAHLGGTTGALDRERVALGAGTHRVEHRAGYDVHHLLREDGEIRQYSDSSGRIFAVAWQTHLPVRLADLLESPAAAATAVAAPAPAAAAISGRHSASVVAGDRVVHIVRMSHLYMGVAQQVSRIPRGVDARELR